MPGVDWRRVVIADLEDVADRRPGADVPGVVEDAAHAAALVVRIARTRRQRHVLRLLLAGWSQVEIAAELRTSPATVCRVVGALRAHARSLGLSAIPDRAGVVCRRSAPDAEPSER